MRSGECASSGSTRNLVRGDGNQIERTRFEFHNLQISDHRYLEKVFKNLRPKLNLAEEACTRLEDQCTDLGIVYVDNNESLCSSWTNENLEVYSNTNFEELKNLFDLTKRLIWNMKPRF